MARTVAKYIHLNTLAPGPACEGAIRLCQGEVFKRRKIFCAEIEDRENDRIPRLLSNANEMFCSILSVEVLSFA